jgi:hypothetical protein
MNPRMQRARLCLMAAAILFLLGGLVFAVSRWNNAAIDRAFVEAAARAATAPASQPLPPRYWAPTSAARPSPAATAQVEAVEAARTRPSPAAPPAATGQKPAAAAP